MATVWPTDWYQAPLAVDTLRVLVVEEHVDTADQLAAQLAAWDCRVQVHDDGSSALAIAQEFQPHIAAISLSLPDMCGYEVACRLRECARTRRVVLISLSKANQGRERGSANALNFDFHLLKPVDTDAFHRAVSQIAHDYGLPKPHPRLRVLVVDHGRDVARGLATWFRRRGCEVKVCLDAAEAMEAVDAFAPQLIVIETDGLGVDACSLAGSLRIRTHGTRARLISLVEPGFEKSCCCSGDMGFDLYLSALAGLPHLQQALNELLAAYETCDSYCSH